eukprot:m.469083 g.469083  ORF g.469083 m.469083 type:complete len:306 (+) comp28090_c0_seq1:69-986(+)
MINILVSRALVILPRNILDAANSDKLAQRAVVRQLRNIIREHGPLSPFCRKELVQLIRFQQILRRVWSPHFCQLRAAHKVEPEHRGMWGQQGWQRLRQLAVQESDGNRRADGPCDDWAGSVSYAGVGVLISCVVRPSSLPDLPRQGNDLRGRRPEQINEVRGHPIPDTVGGSQRSTPRKPLGAVVECEDTPASEGGPHGVPSPAAAKVDAQRPERIAVPRVSRLLSHIPARAVVFVGRGINAIFSSTRSRRRDRRGSQVTPSRIVSPRGPNQPRFSRRRGGTARGTCRRGPVLCGPRGRVPRAWQ